ncbi:YhcH/YjgK/YiaL family protein [Olsenella urininfantis]|uniref:YhcH/YjgK/YiaL family protein n=1 Tax=Olsenella urininfantis TaxID=1871033 RepID=UPI0013564148|nr:YhcH/YjgK/YiaL family protein [Olsenella urininfantis]
MIVSSLSHVSENYLSSPQLESLLAWIGEQGLESLPCGRHDIDGDALFANVMEFETVDASQKDFEAHRRYADLHLCIRGEERIGVVPVAELESIQEFSEQDDFGLYGEPEGGARTSWVTLRAGEFCVTPPSEAHKPGCCAGGPASLKKICFKLLVG